MSRRLGPYLDLRIGFLAGLIVSRRGVGGGQLRAGFLTLLLFVLACAPGANSRGLFHRPEYKAGLLGSSQHPGHNRMLSQTDELGMRKGVAFNKRFGGVKEILSTAPKEHKPLWCIAKDYANPDLILSSLNWACSKSGGGVDCKPVQPNGSCFQPDTLHNHASYAFNMYYQKHGFAPETCDFDGAATVTSTDPSTPGCTYLNSIVASNNTVFSSSLSKSMCGRGCVAAVVGSVLLSSIMS